MVADPTVRPAGGFVYRITHRPGFEIPKKQGQTGDHMNQGEGQQAQFSPPSATAPAREDGGVAVEGILAPIDGKVSCQMAARKPQKLNPVMAIISFFPMDDPSVPVIQFIFAPV